MGSIESIKIMRAENLSELAKQKFGVKEGFVKVITTRDSPAKTTVVPLNKSPADSFREIMRK